MIFLFFGTSLALLEAELAPFEDWEEIEFSNVINCQVVALVWKASTNHELEIKAADKVVAVVSHSRGVQWLFNCATLCNCATL